MFSFMPPNLYINPDNKYLLVIFFPLTVQDPKTHYSHAPPFMRKTGNGYTESVLGR